MKKLLVACILLIGVVTSVCAEIVTLPIPGAPGLSITAGTGANALPLQNINTNPNAVNITQSDDSWTNVPLGFNFPFFGRTFTNSWAMTNGMVTFQDPVQSGIYGACCSGVDLRNTTNAAWNYSIFGVHTDLYSWNPNSQYYLRGNNEMTYGWYNLSQCCSSQGGNSFEIKINSAGVVDTRIAGALVQYNAVTSGMSGDLTRGEYFQAYHGSGLIINTTTGGVSWNTAGGFTGSDPCITNPLSSPTCSGYAAAYMNQQCTISALYNPACPGYQSAYLTQQCSADPLYSAQCPGYQTAYFNQQCNANPLYNVNCPGYATAYLNQQCSANPLYSTTCSGYETAYFNQQCSQNPLYNSRCTGYAQAYLTQQCGINPLYSTTCTGYADAYFSQQCSISGLYSTRCPNYQQAYFADQCSKNGLYSTQCPNYATAYATWLALQPVATTTTTSSSSTNATTTTTTTAVTSTSTSDGSSSVPIAVVADPVVNQAVTSTATSTSPAAAATATVSLVQAAPAPQPAAPQQSAPQEKKADASPSSGGAPSTQTAQTETKADAKPTARQEIQAKREAAAKAEAVEKGKNLANEMGKSADMESQKQVQNVVIQAMGFTPGFDTYNKAMIPDVIGYKPYIVYAGQTNVDNKRLGRNLYGPSDKLHGEMVDSQYKGR